jgi:hypothetical protein
MSVNNIFLSAVEATGIGFVVHETSMTLQLQAQSALPPVIDARIDASEGRRPNKYVHRHRPVSNVDCSVAPFRAPEHSD